MFGWVYETITAIGERKFLGAIREELLSPLEGEIVEIGAGTGASFPYYKPSTHVLAIEPDPSMLAGARKRAKSARARIATS
jgi:predicted RNA methylase